jgi:uncharacterized protein
MLWGGHSGGLEIRRSGDGVARLRGAFPYNRETTLSDGGRTGRARKEVIASHAFSYRVDDPKEDIHLLVGHDYAQPLASRSAGTLDIHDGAEALAFEARISPELQAVSWVKDALGALAAGLVGGISPGFRVPDPNAETVEQRGDAILRTIRAALLFEVSLVTRPAYPQTQIEARNWSPGPCGQFEHTGLRRALSQWRA